MARVRWRRAGRGAVRGCRSGVRAAPQARAGSEARPGRSGARTAQTGIIHSVCRYRGICFRQDAATSPTPSRSPRLRPRVRITGGRNGWVVGFDRWCPVVGATPMAESAAERGRYTWQGTATVRVVAAPRSRREHRPGRPGYIPRTAEHHKAGQEPGGNTRQAAPYSPPNGRRGKRGARYTPVRPTPPPTGRRNDPPPAPVTPVPTPTPFVGRRAEPSNFPPHGRCTPRRVPCGNPRCRGARHHAYRSDP